VAEVPKEATRDRRQRTKGKGRGIRIGGLGHEVTMENRIYKRLVTLEIDSILCNLNRKKYGDAQF